MGIENLIIVALQAVREKNTKALYEEAQALSDVVTSTVKKKHRWDSCEGKKKQRKLHNNIGIERK